MNDILEDTEVQNIYIVFSKITVSGITTIGHLVLSTSGPAFLTNLQNK